MNMLADPYYIAPMGPWADKAACKGYRQQHGTAAWTRVWFPAPAIHAFDKALAICAACPVRAECADWALTNRVEHGVWGGMTRSDRLAYWRKRAAAGKQVRKPRQRPAHGTVNGYYWEIRNLGWSCDDCRHARHEHIRHGRPSRAKVTA